MMVTVRRAGVDDFETLFGLIEALADYEKLSPPDLEARGRLKQHGWPDSGGAPRFKAWLAELSEQLRSDTEPAAHGQALPAKSETRCVAYAISFETYSSFLARPTLYIEDIFVLPDYRRGGVGTALFAHLLSEARSNDCGRVEWVVLDWNTSAQQFYQRHGAQHLTEWQYYRLPVDADG